MVVIGNNIINLKQGHKAFELDSDAIKNTFTLSELIFAGFNHEFHTLQCMYAMKICAHKCMAKLDMQKEFNPKEYQVDLNHDRGHLKGKVYIGNMVFYAKCIDDENFIRCVATNHPEKLNLIKSFHLRINGKNNEKKIEEKIQRFNHTPPLVLHKLNNNIPVITTEDFLKRLELSLTKTDKMYYVSVLPEWIKVNVSHHKPMYNAVYA